MTSDIFISRGINKRTCEDAAGYVNNVFWVIDGASVPQNLDSEKYNAKWLVDHFNKFLHFYFRNSPTIELNIALREAIKHIKSLIPLPYQQAEILPSATLAILRVNVDTVDYVIIGDCSITLKSAGESNTISDLRLQNFGQEIRNDAMELIKKGYSFKSPELKSLIEKLVLEERSHMNRVGGYWVISISEEAVDHCISGSINHCKLFDILLYTDGFGRLVTKYGRFSNDEKLIKSVKENGIIYNINLLRQIEEQDKLGQKYPRTSFSDDATCIFLTNEKNI